jgi:hypothetical protein
VKKQIIFLLLVLFALVSKAQTGLSSPLTISNGKANIDGNNNYWATYMCTSSDPAWTAYFSNIADNENIRVFYKKTTADDCIITFPQGTKFSQPAQTAGVTIAGVNMTLNSTANGSFIILIIRTGSVINASCSRAAN